ncbi:MAG: pyrimidine-nucleoside phosphorylase, partial [Pyrinomonadaceae bacterium]
MIDSAVGFYVYKGLGCQVAKGDPLGVVHSNGETHGLAAAERIAAVYEIGEEAMPVPSLIHDVIS